MLVKELIGKGEPGSLDWQGQTLEFVYNPNAISYRERKALRSMVLAQEQNPEDPETDWLILYVTRMLKSWELYATPEDKKAKRPVPVERSFLDELPSAFLLALVTRLGETVSPPP